jgi:forkhead transcription factor HCM1
VAVDTTLNDLEISQKMNVITSKSGKHITEVKAKRLSATIDELSLPLTTPPHTVSRSETTTRSKKTKQHITPTIPQGRTKRSAKDMPSPQYSSPSTGQTERERTVKKVSKPPQPSFVTPKASKKQPAISKEESDVLVLPSPRKMPKVVYDSDQKPPYSYATLIGMAILRGDDRKLTLSQIYNWISSTFRYYKMNDVGWQNSIRHNLSLNKAFIKTEKSSDGKGHYWEVAKGFEMQFVKAKNGKRALGGQLDHTKRDEPKLIQPAPIQEIPKKRPVMDTSDDEEFSEDEVKPQQQTPKAQIRSTDTYERVLKKSNSAIGLQRFSIPKVSYDDISDDEPEVEEAKVPKKRSQLKSVSTGNGQLKNIPSLEAPETNWAASALGERIIFGQVKPDSPKDRFANLPLTSSFSCNTNFELSPLKRQETGPLLEPLTPGSRIPSFSSNLTIPSSQTTMRSPLNSSHHPYAYQFLRTPTAKIRTPNGNTNSIMRKFWASPSTMDDFYTSPSIPRNSDDSYHETLFGSPERSYSKKQLFQESSGSYDLFGVDICSVVKRAVESSFVENRLDSVLERGDSTTDEDDHGEDTTA